jgi:hypothetical protein
MSTHLILISNDDLNVIILKKWTISSLNQKTESESESDRMH